MTNYQQDIPKEVGENLTGSSQHLFTSKHRIRARHEAHRLLRLGQGVPSSGEPNDGAWKDNPRSRNRAEEGVIRNRLRSGG